MEKNPLHGTYKRYQRGCRCGQCRFANAMYHYDYRATRRDLAEARMFAAFRRSKG